MRMRFTRGQISQSQLNRITDKLQVYGLSTSTILQSLKIVYSARGLLLLNFYRPPRTNKTLDHSTVLSDKAEDVQALERAVSGSVVFIAHSSRSAVDQVDGMPTVYTQNGLDLSDVEIAATVFYITKLEYSSAIRLADFVNFSRAML